MFRVQVFQTLVLHSALPLVFGVSLTWGPDLSCPHVMSLGLFSLLR